MLVCDSNLLLCFVQNEKLLWEQELYSDFQYKDPRPYFHTFECEVSNINCTEFYCYKCVWAHCIWQNFNYHINCTVLVKDLIFSLLNWYAFECLNPDFKLPKPILRSACIGAVWAFTVYDSVWNSSINQRLHASSREAAVDIGTLNGCKSSCDDDLQHPCNAGMSSFSRPTNVKSAVTASEHPPLCGVATGSMSV